MYEQKYFKYKFKYLSLKNKQLGKENLIISIELLRLLNLIFQSNHFLEFINRYELIGVMIE